MRPLREIIALGETQLLAVEQTLSAYDAAERMRDADASAAVVCEGDQVRGIITEHDFLERIVCADRPARDTPVTRVMSTPVIGVDVATSFAVAAELMARRNIRHLVVRDGKPVGIITARDMLLVELAERRRYIDDLEHYLYRYR